MKIRFWIATTAVTTIMASSAIAADVVFVEPSPAPITASERMLILEAEILGGYTWRGDDAITSSEDDGFGMIGGGVLAAIPMGESFLLQFELDGENAFSDDGDDNYGGIVEGGGHIAWTNQNYLFGAFGGLGAVETDGEANFAFGGLEARMNFTNASLAVQGGYLAGSSEDEEVLDNAYFVRGIAQYFANDGRTKFQGDLAYISGEQDTNQTTPDELDVIAWGLEVEHAPSFQVGGGTFSVFGAYEGHRMVEDNDDTIVDHTVMAGLRFRFGASTPKDRAYNTAPDLPGFGRIVGATPAID